MWGHGRSVQKNSPAFFSFSNMAQDLFALLDRLKIKKIKAIGCSGGGGALLHMATQ
jgi:pimeloyl-ACP methyl ester carboxylesterase